jgi:arylsulfatase A-like enzyme
MRWPQTIKPGSRAQDIIHVTDLFTTFARMAGAEDYVPRDRLIDGVDQTPMIFPGETHGRRDYIFIYERPTLESIEKQ